MKTNYVVFVGKKKSPMSTKLGYFLCLKLANWSEHTTFAIVIQKKKKSGAQFLELLFSAHQT